MTISERQNYIELMEKDLSESVNLYMLDPSETVTVGPHTWETHLREGNKNYSKTAICRKARALRQELLNLIRQIEEGNND